MREVLFFVTYTGKAENLKQPHMEKIKFLKESYVMDTRLEKMILEK